MRVLSQFLTSGLPIRIEIDNFLQMFLRITKTRRENDQVGFESLAIFKFNYLTFVTTHGGMRFIKPFESLSNNCAPGHRFGKPARAPAKQTSRNLLRQPREVVNVDTEDPMWNRDRVSNAATTTRDHLPVSLATNSQEPRLPTRHHLQPEAVARSGEIFGAHVNTVPPAATASKMKVIRQSRLADDAGCIDHMTAAQLMLLTVACSITNREPACLFFELRGPCNRKLTFNSCCCWYRSSSCTSDAEWQIRRRIGLGIVISGISDKPFGESSLISGSTRRNASRPKALFKDHVFDVSFRQRFRCCETCRTRADNDHGIAGDWLHSYSDLLPARHAVVQPTLGPSDPTRTFASFVVSAFKR